ncbi:hypothetical protein MMYC01_205313 [Madurella mycetomatis]|uniref:Uncharacterized protein n=1 Tax=Madurella mycetomatis TaxID=100816 RepID=A0A175VXN9_9PEZI|nr:hypothetical protein MMYC01_205313 [Madurella mycetomatis]
MWLEPEAGPVGKRFLLSADTGLTYTERVYEGGDAETKVFMVKYVAVAIFFNMSSTVAVGLEFAGHYLARPVQDKFARHMSDPFASNMLLHQCTPYIEGRTHEHRIQRNQAAILELRTILLSINDVLSVTKELLTSDTTSSLAMLTKERRFIDTPGTERDGGWCLRDSLRRSWEMPWSPGRASTACCD